MKGIKLSTRSEKPIYQQLYEQISSQVLNGELGGDFSLPPIRTTAKELRVSIITVKKAWEALEKAGLIYTITGRGCFIADITPKERKQKRQEILRKQFEKDKSFYRNLGVDRGEFIIIAMENY